jgi:hypothetical protein
MDEQSGLPEACKLAKLLEEKTGELIPHLNSLLVARVELERQYKEQAFNLEQEVFYLHRAFV